MKHTPKGHKSEIDELSVLLNRVRMPEYERMRVRAQLERAQAIGELLQRAASAVRSLIRAAAARLSHRARERTA